MDKVDFFVNTSPEVAANKVYYAVTQSLSGELIDEYRRNLDDGKKVIMLVFEKYYMRSSNRATLTMVADNLDGMTKVHLSSGGGGDGLLFRFSWGANSSFLNLAKKALEEEIVE